MLAPPLLFGDDHYIEAPRPGPGLLPAVTAEDALSDLPRITAHLRGKMKRGARRFVNLVPYGQGPQSGYARQMREWPGFEAGEGIFDHVIRYLPRDYAIFRRMKPGDQYPQAHAVAVRLFEERLAAARKERPVKKGSRAYRELWKATVPPYDATKFPNKWRKMERDQPARTLMAHLGKDGYSHIHYDSGQARTISVREAAQHSKIELTMQTYTDLRLVDLHGEIERLPKPPVSLPKSLPKECPVASLSRTTSHNREDGGPGHGGAQEGDEPALEAATCAWEDGGSDGTRTRDLRLDRPGSTQKANQENKTCRCQRPSRTASRLLRATSYALRQSAKERAEVLL